MEIGICFASKSARLGQEGVIAEINYQCQGMESALAIYVWEFLSGLGRSVL